MSSRGFEYQIGVYIIYDVSPKKKDEKSQSYSFTHLKKLGLELRYDDNSP